MDRDIAVPYEAIRQWCRESGQDDANHIPRRPGFGPAPGLSQALLGSAGLGTTLLPPAGLAPPLGYRPLARR